MSHPSLPWSRWARAAAAALVLASIPHAPSAATPALPQTPRASTQQPQPEAATAPNLDALTASFLGVGGRTDRQHAIDIGRDRGVIVGGQVSGQLPGARTSDLGGSTGTVIRLDGEGRTVRSVTRIGSVVDDLEINRNTGAIAVIGDFGVALLNEAATETMWQDGTCAGTGGRRVATDHSGMVAALCGGSVSLFQTDGNRVALFEPEHQTVEDVALLDKDGSELVVVTGHDETTGEQGLQVGYVEAYDFRGELQWRAYGWEGERISDFTDNTRGVRVVRGHDRRVYLLGEVDGPDNAFQVDAQDPERPARLVGVDAYDTPDERGGQGDAQPMVFLARLNAENGRQIAGRFVLARTPEGQPAPTYGRALAADLFGNVVIGGMAACCVPRREEQTVAGQPVPPPGGTDAFVLSLNTNLTDRKAWTAWGQGGEVLGTVSVAGVAGMAATMTSGAVVTHEALPGQDAAAGNVSEGAPEGYFATWRSPEHPEHPPGLTAEQVAAEAARAEAQTAAPEEGAEAVSPLAPDASSTSESEGGDNFLLVTVVLVLLAVTPATVSAANRRSQPATTGAPASKAAGGQPTGPRPAGGKPAGGMGSGGRPRGR